MNKPNFNQGKIIEKHIGINIILLMTFWNYIFFKYWYSPTWRYAGTLPQKGPKKSNDMNDPKSVLKENKVQEPSIR